jgi:hypothetical protein
MRDIGIVHLAIQNVPYKFKIDCDNLNLGTEDLLKHFPVAYYFKDLTLLRNAPILNFEVRPTSLLIRVLENKKIVGTELDNIIIRLASAVFEFPLSNNIIILETTDYEDYLGEPIIEGIDLKVKILQFCYEIYKYKPQEQISARDLWYNLTAEIDDISSWSASLAEKGLLIKTGSPMIS